MGFFNFEFFLSCLIWSLCWSIRCRQLRLRVCVGLVGPRSRCTHPGGSVVRQVNFAKDHIVNSTNQVATMEDDGAIWISTFSLMNIVKWLFQSKLLIFAQELVDYSWVDMEIRSKAFFENRK